MIDIALDDIVAERRSSGDRFVLFTKTDLPTASALPWWGVILDTGSDGHGILVRLDAKTRAEGWTAFDLLLVARGRSRAEAGRDGGIVAGEIAHAITTATSIEARRSGQFTSSGSVRFLSDGRPSPYVWTVANSAARRFPCAPIRKESGKG